MMLSDYAKKQLSALSFQLSAHHAGHDAFNPARTSWQLVLQLYFDETPQEDKGPGLKAPFPAALSGA
jgi:hypothetical protein